MRQVAVIHKHLEDGSEEIITVLSNQNPGPSWVRVHLTHDEDRLLNQFELNFGGDVRDIELLEHLLDGDSVRGFREAQIAQKEAPVFRLISKLLSSGTQVGWQACEDELRKHDPETEEFDDDTEEGE